MQHSACFSHIMSIHADLDSKPPIVRILECKKQIVHRSVKEIPYQPSKQLPLFRRQLCDALLQSLNSLAFQFASKQHVVLLDRFIPEVLDNELAEFI
jgi:hypothetical protein